MTVASAKDLIIKPVSAKDAAALVRRVHYSGSVVMNSQLHLGVFLNGRLEGVMQFGPSTDKRKLQGLVTGTGWNDFIELNRMAFSEALPRNSESRALGVAFRLIRKRYPHLKWVVSFADGAQCGDGTIYRASGFLLTGIRKNTSIWSDADGNTVSRTTMTKGTHILKDGAASTARMRADGFKPIEGYQLRYVYFLDPAARDGLTVPVIPFNEIERLGAGMYRGKKVSRGKGQDAGHPPALGGSTPTPTLHSSQQTELTRPS